MKLEKVKKLRKGLVIALVAGVVASQTIPAVHSGTSAKADTDETELAADEQAEQEDTREAQEPDNSQAPAEDSTGGTGQTGNDSDTSGQSGDNGENKGEADPSEEKEAEPSDNTDSTKESQEGDQDQMGLPETQNISEPEKVTNPETPAEAEAAQQEVQEASEEAAPETQQTGATTGAAVNAASSYEQAGTWYPAPSGELVPSPVIYRGFRFWTVAKDYAFAKDSIQILEEQDQAARAVGTLKKNALCYILKSEDGWSYVESGDVRGFVETKQIRFGEEARGFLAAYESQATFLSNVSGLDESVDTLAPVAEALISKEENAAFDYYRATVYQTVVEKDYALPAAGRVNIREEASDGSRVAGVLEADGICYVIADRDGDWVYVESGDVRGFVKQEELILSENAGDADILTKDEDDYTTAEESLKPEENKALYYTITSIRSGVPIGMERTSILQYAAEFIGNPYVWGGTSLTNGADCSGFVQSIFAQYGYTLPRTAAEQSRVGTQIPVEDAQPGDLIFYGRGGNIYHVVIYAGDGKTIEAKSTKAGIVSSEVSYKNAVWAVRVIDEQQAVRYEIPDGLGSIHTYMGWQKVTMKGSQQYAFRESAGMTFDPEGFAVVDNRYVIACTTTFGNIGDYIDFYQADGTVIPCVIGDFKNQNDAGCNVYGHMNGRCIVEFVVDQNSWYRSGHANPGTASCHPEWNQPIIRAENVGSYYD